MPPTRRIGRIAIAITTIPMPPSHCSIDRQIRMPGGASFSPTITVEPVVVIPDIDSKNASVIDRSSSENTSGSAPNRAIVAHAPVVITNAWRMLKLPQPVRVVRIIDTPTNTVTAAEATNTAQSR